MTTTHTSVTDAKPMQGLADYLRSVASDSLSSTNQGALRHWADEVEQFAQSRQPSSEAVELPRITNSLRQCQIGERCECGSDYKDCAFYRGDDAAAIKAAHPQPAAPAGPKGDAGCLT